MFTEKEIAKDVDTLIKLFLEMKVVTNYKIQEKFNLQKLSLWSNNILKKESEENVL